jgi:predicted Rossmann fold nucleotide-binding protein DprA/Smf involved in DNA uptake
MDLLALVAAVEPAEPDGDPAGPGPEDRRILDSCREPVTVAEVAAATALPVSRVRVRLADLIQRGRVTLQPQPPTGEEPGPGLLTDVLDGLRTL